MKNRRFSAVIRFTQTGLICWLILQAGSLIAVPQDLDRADGTELTEEETRQIQTTERFFGILEKNPRFGTALDRVYGHHVEFGSLDSFLQSLQERSEKETGNGALWMLLGMFESQRGNDAAAVEALSKADQLRSDDALASFYLGQTQLRVGQSDEAIASFERAISRQPARADLLEVFQTLGRVHQRAQRTDEAMKVWQRLEALFPDDPRVLEQIAVTLEEEGQSAEALSRYQQLAQLVGDEYRRVIFQVTAAELTIKTGQRDQGIQSLEQVLAELNPESWLYRDVRRRIDDVFLRSGDQDSLVKYYQDWLAGHPDDVEGMARLARFLSSSARVPEATEWMEKALKLAPSRTDLRKAFIDQLVNDQRFPEAIKQYEQLSAAAPGHPDFLRDWGRLVLRNREMPEVDRKTEAVRIWNQILATRPDDALTVSQVADLFRQNKLNVEAEGLYRKAVELAPGDPQYREYLGEFLHIQKRSDEALAVWAGIAAGSQRNAINVTRLAEVYNSFGFPEKAIVEIAEAVQLDPKDFSLQIRAADYHAKAEKYEQAISYVDAANALAANDDERDAVIQQRIDVLQVSQQLDDLADILLAQLRDQPDATTADWYLAARYLEASRRWPDANEAIDNAIRLEPKSIPAMTVAARIAETSGDYGRAAQMNRTLADIDRRSRGDHLMNVSRLEAQMGRTDEALKAAQELIVSAPGNTDNYEFYAQTCFRLGRADDGLEALRKAVRINPNEPHLIMALGAALADQLRTDEAIEVYWRAFEKSEEVEDKVGLTMKLTPLYQQINQFDKLIERFERDRREEDKRRMLTLCLAQAWHTASDIGAARQELESLLSEDTRDTNLLNQLAKLCEGGADLEAAIGYQRQLVSIAPGHETEFPLAAMLMANGQMDEAREIFVKLTQREEDPVRQIKALDSLITQGNFESAIGVIEPLLAQNRDDWELLYREGVAWASLEKTAEAINRFERILALTLPYDSLGRSAAERLKQAQAKAKSDNLRGITTVVPQKQSPLAMRTMSSQVQMASGLTADNRYYGSNQSPPVWTPEAYGVARMAAFGWLMRFEDEAESSADAMVEQKDASQQDEAAATSVAEAPVNAPNKSIVQSVREKAEPDNAPRQAIYDLLYVAQLKNDFPTTFSVARRLAKAGGKEEQLFYLTSLNLRNTGVNQGGFGSSDQSKAKKTPLSENDLQLARDCFRQLADENRDIDFAAMFGGNVAYGSNGQVYVRSGASYVILPGVFQGSVGFLDLLVEELRLAGQTDEALELLNENLAKASTAKQLAGAMAILLKEKRQDELPAVFDRWQQAALKQIAEAPVVAPGRGAVRSPMDAASANVLLSAMDTIQKWMGALGAVEENAQVVSILERCLTVAEAEARHRRLVQAAQTRRTQALLPSTAIGELSVYYGEVKTQAAVNFPPLSTWVDRMACTLLYQAHEILSRNEVASDLVDMLRKRLQQIPEETDEVDRLLCNRMYLASALWWIEEQDEAIEWAASAAALAVDDLAMQFDLANMYKSSGDFEDALNVIEMIVPRDQRVLQRRELEALQLAEQLGDIDRGRAAAERLFGLRLDANTQIGLVDRMRRLGLSSLADAILARSQRTATNQASSLGSMMVLYQGQGKTEQANQLAHMLLRKTASPIAINLRSNRNPRHYYSQDSGLRTQAVQQLHRTGALKSLIEQLENQLQRSPDSIPALQQLIEFYGVTGQKDETRTTLKQAIAIRPNSAVLRLQLAKQLEQAGQANEACDEYLELLKIQPGWVTDELHQVDRVFTQAKRKTDLVQALSQINLKQISQPYYIVQTASSLLQDESTIDTGLSLLERIFEAFPTYRRYLTQNLRGDAVWKNERVYQLVKRVVLPTVQDIQSNPWVGMDEISGYSGNGEVSVFFHQLLQGLKTSDKLADMESSMQALLDQQPGWHSGHAMLALMELATDRNIEAQSRLKTLVNDEVVLKSMSAKLCWVIGQELDRFEETRELALTLFERAMSASERDSMDQFEYSPFAKLIDSYVRVGRSDEARAILLKKLRSQSFGDYDPDYAAYQRIENTHWAAAKFLKMNSPVDAVKLYREVLDQPEQTAAAARSGNFVEHFEKNARNGLAKALDSITSENADEVIAQLLVVPENIKPGVPAVDLMLSVPDANALAKEQMKSSYVELLTKLSAKQEIADKISLRLAEIAKQHPNDLSIAIAATAWHLGMKHKDASELVERLVVLSGDHPLEAIPEGRRPNSRQRREAALLIPLWLIARECIGTENLDDAGMRLAESCRSAAARQVGTKERSAILYDWGQVLLKANRKDEAEARWTELLDLATERPSRSKAASPPKTGFWRPGKNGLLVTSVAGWFALRSPIQTTALVKDEPQTAAAELIPPLTLSQFRMASTVARSAAQNDMPDLSRRAVMESLKGGFPVADPLATDLNASMNRVVRVSQAPSTANPIETEVVKSLKAIVSLWTGDDYPSHQTYTLLKGLVFPENRPTEIRLYVTATNVAEASVDSLAETLVTAASQSEQLEDLKNAVAARQSNAEAAVSARVLEILIDLDQGQTGEALARLDELAKQIPTGMATRDQHIAFLAAVRSFETPDLKAAAFLILRHNLQQEMQVIPDPNHESVPPISGRLATMVNRYLAETGDQKSVQEHFDNVMLARQSFYNRYGGDHGLHMQTQDFASLAQQASQLKLSTLALEYLGRAWDFEVSRYSRPDMSTTLATTVHHLRTLPVEERYETWYNWTMPREDRQTLRALYETYSPTMIPNAFISADRPDATQLQTRFFSNLTELVEAASQTDKLTDLRKQVESLAEGKMPSADILLTLILIAQDDTAAGVPAVQALRDTFADRMKPKEGPVVQRPPNSLGDYLVYQACLQSKAFVGLFEDQLPRFRSGLQDLSLIHTLRTVNLDWARRVTAKSPPDSTSPGSRLVHWTAVNSGETSGSSRPWWAKYHDQLVKLSGTDISDLFFRYPLTGNFTISMDCFDGSWAEGNAGYGGLRVSSQNFNSRILVQSVSGHESLNRGAGMNRSRPAFNRVAIEVRDGVVRHTQNGQLVYQEEMAATSPWLFLQSNSSHLSAFRNVQITGDVVIPRTVPLIEGDCMDGWNCATFGDSQPRKRLMAETSKQEYDEIRYHQNAEPSEFDWKATDGILNGTGIEYIEVKRHSWIYYHRPLMEGESFDYEFHYTPGKYVAHPTIGQVALMLEPEGVCSHWIATEWDESVHAIEPENIVVETAIRKGPGQLPLKTDDWNSVRLQLLDNTAIVTLNGTVVCERPLEPELSRRFGLFRFRQQSSQIRNAVLTGDWPDRLPSAGEMLELEQPDSPESVLAVATIANDVMIAPLAGEIVQNARTMSADEAFDYLAEWVLPSATHPGIRLYCSQMSETPGASDIDDVRFGNILCPAVELVRLAVEHNRLDPLTAFVAGFETNSPVQQRNAKALEALVALETGDDEAIRDTLKDVWAAVENPYAKGTPANERLAEYIVAWRAGQHPVFWPAGSDIAKRLCNHERDPDTESRDTIFKRQVHALASDIELFARSLPADVVQNATAQSASQWVSVPYLKPDNRQAGHRPSTWSVAKGVVEHFPAETWSQLYFQSPLRGQFEIIAERTAQGPLEVSIVWGMHSAEPLSDLKGVRVGKGLIASKDVTKEVKLPVWDRQAEFRIVVDGRKITTWTNGVQIHQEILARNPDPWLLLQSYIAANGGRVSNLRIVGTPEIPSEIDLINTAGLASWRADIYGEALGTEAVSDANQTVPWQQVGDELVGQLDKLTASEHRESLIVYQRPMLEDGVIEFKTWYEPGSFEVHPALGRLAFMLTPNGVRLHQLTDAQYEIGGLLPDNQHPIPDAAESLTLKEKDWNQVRLSLKGDQLTVAVNGVDSATVSIADPPAERQFGLFRYSNKTQCRVRKLIYRGDWPKALPDVVAQDLAAPAVDGSLLPDAEIMLDADLTQAIENLQGMQFVMLGPDDCRQTTAEGLKLRLHDSKSPSDNPGVSVRQPIDGDCEITLSYRDLEISDANSGGDTSLVLDVVLEDPQQTRVQCDVALDDKQQLQYTAELLRYHPGGGPHSVGKQSQHGGKVSGRLRIVKQGGQIDCYAAPEGSEEFQLLNSFAIGNSKIREINCSGKCSDETAKLDVALTKLTIRQSAKSSATASDKASDR